MFRHSAPPSGSAGPAALTAIAALRGFPATALLIVATVALALMAVLPLASLFVAGRGGLRARLALAPISGGDLGLAWQGTVHPPTELRAETIASLSLLVLGCAVATLALAAVTVIALAVAREAERSSDLAVRQAVGASPRVLRRAAALEAAALVAAAGIAGGLAGAGVARFAAAAWPGGIDPGDATPALMVMGVLAAVTFTGVLLPVVLPRRRLASPEHDRPTPLAPIAVQLAVGLVAIVAAGQLGQRIAELVPRAGHAGSGEVYPLALPSDTTPMERARRWAGLLDDMRRAHRFDSVSLTSPGALLGLGPIGAVTTDCGRCTEGGIALPWRVKPATHQLVSADSFQALDLSLLEGRAITREDDWAAPRVAVVSRSLAAREFQGGRALGRRMRVVGDGAEWSTVVGVVADREPAGLGGTLQPTYAVYLSVLQHPPTAAELLLDPQVGTAPRPARDALRRSLGPGARVGAPLREADLFAAEAAVLAWFRQRLAEQGGAMLALAGLGAFALVRLWLRSIRSELALRRAVGASRRALLRLVLVRLVVIAAAGVALAIGLGVSIWGVLPELVGG